MAETLDDYIKKRFGIKVAMEWMRNCQKWIEGQIEFCEKNFLTRPMMVQSLNKQDFIIDQIINGDLKFINSSPSFLNSLPKNKPLELKRPMIVQISNIIDVSQSIYSQFSKIYDSKIEHKLDLKTQSDESNINETSSNLFRNKNKRMLRFKVTDGHKILDAAEMEFIECLNDDLPDGCKILLQNNIEYFNDVLMLRPNNVTFIGGSINGNIRNQKLALYIKILSSNPKFNERFQKGEFNDILTKELYQTHISDSRFHYLFNKLIKNDEDDKFDSLSNTDLNLNQFQNKFEKSEEIKKEFNQTNCSKDTFTIFNPIKDNKKEDDDDDDCILINDSNIKESSDNQEYKTLIQEHQPNQFDFEILSLNDNSNDDNSPKKVSVPLFQNLQLLHNHLESNEIFNSQKLFYAKIKECSIKSVTSNLSHNNGKYWTLHIKIIDSNHHELECSMSNEFLDDLMEMTAAKCEELKMNAKAGNSVYNHIVLQLKSCKDKIKHLNGTCCLKIEPKHEETSKGTAFLFTITKFTD